jgi:ATP synthase assembly factor FMC1, mitochondrial
MTDLPLRARQLYRALLRELPRRHISLSSPASPSPLKQRFRERFTSLSPTNSPSSTSEDTAEVLLLSQQIQQAEQFVQYAKAQRMYATLVARYNPGMDMDQEERVRLTARRVGMDLPVENVYNDEPSVEEGEGEGVEGTGKKE